MYVCMCVWIMARQLIETDIVNAESICLAWFGQIDHVW